MLFSFLWFSGVEEIVYCLLLYLSSIDKLISWLNNWTVKHGLFCTLKVLWCDISVMSPTNSVARCSVLLSRMSFVMPVCYHSACHASRSKSRAEHESRWTRASLTDCLWLTASTCSSRVRRCAALWRSVHSSGLDLGLSLGFKGKQRSVHACGCGGVSGDSCVEGWVCTGGVLRKWKLVVNWVINRPLSDFCQHWGTTTEGFRLLHGVEFNSFRIKHDFRD